MTVAEGEVETEVEGKKKGGKKKLIMMTLVIVLIGGFAAKTFLLKPKPLSADQLAAKAADAKLALEAKCAGLNGLPAPAAPPHSGTSKKSATTTTSTAAPAGVDGPVLTQDSVTVNLADGHFLKLGIGLQLPVGTDPTTAKDANMGTKALDYVITTLRTKTMSDLGPTALAPLTKRLGNDICVMYDAKVTNLYFTDFVMQ